MGSLTRLRVGSHLLGIERGRYTRPVTPIEQRICKFCDPRNALVPAVTRTPPSSSSTAQIDTEEHFLIQCPFFLSERNCLFGKLTAFEPEFSLFNDREKFLKFLCPTMPQTVKVISR